MDTAAKAGHFHNTLVTATGVQFKGTVSGDFDTFFIKNSWSPLNRQKRFRKLFVFAKIFAKPVFASSYGAQVEFFKQKSNGRKSRDIVPLTGCVYNGFNSLTSQSSQERPEICRVIQIFIRTKIQLC